MSPEDRERTKELLPLLDKLAHEHPDDSVTSMATDLRTAIATHGFVLSELLNQSNVHRNEAFDQTRARVNDKIKTTTTSSAKSKQQTTSGASKPTGDNKTSSTGAKPKAAAKTKESTTQLLEPTCKKSVIDILTADLEELELSNKENLDSALNGGLHPIDQLESSGGAKKALIEVIQPGEYDFLQPSCVDADDDVTTSSSAASGNKDYKPTKEQPLSTSSLQQALKELLDPLIPVRGHALISLRRLLEAGDEETCAKQDTLLEIFTENMKHDDSYMYLASIQGLCALAERSPQQVVPLLADEYATFDRRQTHYKQRHAEARLKLGEVIMKTIRQLGKN